MKPIANRFRVKYGALFQWRLLRTKVTLFTLGIFLVSLWSLAFYASRILHKDIEHLLEEQQFSTVSFVAQEVNAEFDDRVKALQTIAARITPGLISKPPALQAMLEDQPLIYSLFNNGVAVAGLDGTVIADFPHLPNRIGANFKERDYISGPLKEGKVTIGRPVMSKIMHAPAFVIGVPIRNARGEVIGVIGGVTDLRLPNFLEKVTENRYGKTGGYVLIAPQHHLRVTGNDKSLIMKPTPAPGINPLVDRYMQGFEGSGVTVDSYGIEVLTSAKQIPVAGWIIVARIPTEEAFAPIHAMMWRVLIATVFLTLLAGGLTWWMLKRQLAPIFSTINTLAALSSTDRYPQPLPITRQDEIGELIGGFNHLLETLRKREEELKKTEERYRTLFSRANDGIFILTADGRVVEVNESLARMHGYSRQEMLNMNLKDLDTPETFKLLAERMRRICAGEALTFEVEHYHKDGHVFPLEVSTSSIPYGDEVYIQCFHRDLTERKRVEEEKQRMEERLQRAEKMEALGLLAGGVAHDLNNVMGIVVGYAEMLMDEIGESSPLKDDLMKIMEGGNRSAAIVQDLLTLARRGVQTAQIVNLNEAIISGQKTPEYKKVIACNPNVCVETSFEADLLNIMGSPVHLFKTFINLVANAVEAMPGGGRLTITTRNQALDKPVHGYDAINVGDYVVLSITDTGGGISDSDIKRIFEPFYTRKVMGQSGTGLGLAVVWGTVKDHNAYIDVQSEIGKGTIFTLYFPVTREGLVATEKAIPLSDYIGNEESILVIDDIKEQREMAARMLGKLNYRVKTVASGEEAVEYLRTEKADLIVLDMIMDPGMDGLDTYKAILEIHPKQKAIIVSGFSETERVEEAKMLGARTYLRKPYIQEKLGLAVRNELERIS